MEMKQEHAATSETWEGYVDWRNRPALRGRHGGKLAASFVLATEVLENLAFVANASNMVSYLLHDMHFTPALAANAITNFIGTAFFLALLGGFLSDALCNSYVIYLLSATVEFLGLAVLFVQARTPSLKPPECHRETGAAAPCEMLSGGNAALLYAGLYIVALGMGGIKGSLPAQGADQFDEGTARGRKDLSTFFNYFIFCLNFGGLIAVTAVVWVEDNLGWMWGFAITTISILLSIPVFLAGSTTYRNKLPTGSPLTTIAKVICAATFNTTNKTAASSSQNPSAIVDMATPSPTWTNSTSTMGGQEEHSKHEEEDAILRVQQGAKPSTTQKEEVIGSSGGGGGFLARAVEREPVHHSLACTVEEVEDVKVVVGLMPTFLCTIMFSCCLAQLNTFSVQQAATMNTKMGSLTVPPASLPVFPIVFMLILIPLYDHAVVPFARKVTGTEAGITNLQRIGVGLVLSIAAMAVAGFVEVKRKDVATQMGMLDSHAPLPISFLWVAPQYLLLGSADLFTLAGLLEFFFTEAPRGMRSLSTALSWASLALGQYVSSLLVSIVNGVTGTGGRKAWLSEHSLNHNRLEKFYWLMTVMGIANFLIYLVLTVRYKYRSTTYHMS